MFTLPPMGNKPISADFYVVLRPGRVESAKFISGADELQGAAQRIQAAKITVPFPEGSKAEILRRGVLFCSPLLHACQFMLEMPQDANDN
jgi:hypothetical protein